MYERFYISGRPEKLKVHVYEQAEKNLKSDFNILKRKKNNVEMPIWLPTVITSMIMKKQKILSLRHQCSGDTLISIMSLIREDFNLRLNGLHFHFDIYIFLLFFSGKMFG